jgi:phosphoribosyl 1,2-cyclic phosphodiesterase
MEQVDMKEDTVYELLTGETEGYVVSEQTRKECFDILHVPTRLLFILLNAEPVEVDNRPGAHAPHPHINTHGHRSICFKSQRTNPASARLMHLSVSDAPSSPPLSVPRFLRHNKKFIIMEKPRDRERR